jgi:hypothetical protein
MNEYLKKFREQYPEYDDIPDQELALALHAKFYSDMSFEDFASKIGMDTGAGRTWEEPGRGERIIAQNERSLGLPADMTAMQFGDKMAGQIGTYAGARLGMQGLGAATNAIRGLRPPPPMVPSPSGLVGPSGSPLMVSGQPAAPRTALNALRALARSPVAKRVGPYVKGAIGLDMIRRVF